jgi:hypothetical protein
LTIEFEGRETQAAESWRIQASRKWCADHKELWRYCVSIAITKRIAEGVTWMRCVSVKVPVTQILEVYLQAKPVSNLSI